MNKNERDRKLIDVFLDYRSNLKFMLRKFVPSADIEDIVQETFIRAHEAEALKHIEYPKAYMHTTARNLALKMIAKKDNSSTMKLEDMLNPEVYSIALQHSDSLESKEKFRLFCMAVQTLPRQCRKAFILKRVFGCSTKEISAMLEISISTTEKHIAKGVLMCADFLHERGYEVNKRIKHAMKNSNHQ